MEGKKPHKKKSESIVEGEVDVAYVDKNRFWPIEVKWRNQMRAKDLKQITKYKNSRIFAKVKKS